MLTADAGVLSISAIDRAGNRGPAREFSVEGRCSSFDPDAGAAEVATRYALPHVTKPANLGSLSANPAHRSFFRDRVQGLAGDRPLEDWLVEEANVRGHLGATGPSIPDRVPTPELSDGDLVVALLMPHSQVDGRLFKLVVRLLQRTSIDPKTLWFHARRERADRVLYWLLSLVPLSERTASITALIEACPAPPRGYRGVQFNYSSARLLRRPATKESVWRAARR